MATNAVPCVNTFTETHIESLKRDVVSLEKLPISTDEKIRRLKERAEATKLTFSNGVDGLIKNVEGKNPGPAASANEKEKYNMFLDEVTNELAKIGKWINFLFEKLSEAIEEIINLLRTAAHAVLKFATDTFDTIKSWWNMLW